MGLDFDPVRFVGFMFGFVIGTTFHEFMHAYSALRLGDTTAQQQGRITLNPAAHFDPFGFFMGILLALGLFVPLRSDRASRSWDSFRVIFGSAWLVALGRFAYSRLRG